MPCEQLDEVTFALRIEMLHDHKCQPGPCRDGIKKVLERFESACRGSDTHDTKTITGTVQIASAPAARASLQLSDDATKLQVRRMPPPPAGKVYQVWLKRPNQDPAPTTALFRTDPKGSADVEIQRGRLKGVEQVLVTAEPDGGSMKPTSAPVIVASPA